MRYRPGAEAILAVWAEVERELRNAAPESEEAATLVDESSALRAEHLPLVTKHGRAIVPSNRRGRNLPSPEPAVTSHASPTPVPAIVAPVG